jgi:sugar-specific transcriptional regulator TrmB
MKNVFKRLDFTDKETAVYLTLLEEGPSSLRRLAAATSLNRGTVYNILKGLMRRGIVRYYKTGRRQHFIAEHPDTLLGEAERQQQQLKVTVEQLKSALPELHSLYNDASDKPKVRYYEGTKGIRNILDDVLKTLKSKKQKSYIAYSSVDMRPFLYKCYPEFTEKRIRAGINVDVISTGPGGRLCGLDRRKWITEDRASNTYIIVYADRTAYIVHHKRSSVGVLIESSSIADTHRCLFTALWKRLS